ADWRMVWVQLLGIAIIGTIFGLIGSAIGVASNPFTGTSVNPNTFLAFTVSGSIFSIISVPLGFFIIVGVQYLLAKGFQGQGTFLAQSYTRTLFDVPLSIGRYVLGIIPFLGGLIGLALSIYGIVLNVYSIMAVHRLSGGKASLVVLLPIIVLYLVLFLCVLAAVAFFFAAYRTTSP
ncbi:MAG TPA: YIP1 family protein, partial [Ktedonobacteraceae bacterium]